MNSYTVPPEHVRKRLTLAADAREVRQLDGAALVARDHRCSGRRELVEDRKNRNALLDDPYRCARLSE